MKIQRRSFRFVAVAVVISLPLLGMSGVASAKVKAKGCHKTHSCKSGAGAGSGTGSPATSAPITIQIDPNPLVETGTSDVVATIQVESSPSFAGDAVNIDSSQLQASCGGEIEFENLQNGGTPANLNLGFDDIRAILDDDGNVTVMVVGENCAPGTSVVEADLAVAPYATALGTLVANPPVVTPEGLTGYPTTSGTVTTGEVETGDTSASGDSDVYAVFYVETSPVYAEQTVEISSSQLQGRCVTGWRWAGTNTLAMGVGAVNPGAAATSLVDDDGNAIFLFFGTSCAAGSSEVIADVEAGSHPTYTTTFTIDPPQPTI